MADVNSVNEILESLGRKDASGSMNAIKKYGRSVTGHAVHMGRTVNGLVEQYRQDPTERNLSAVNSASGQLSQVSAHRDALKSAVNFVQGGGLARGDGIPPGLIDSLTKTASAATKALAEFNSAAEGAASKLSNIGKTAAQSGGGGGSNNTGNPANVMNAGQVNGGAGGGGNAGGGGGGNTAGGGGNTGAGRAQNRRSVNGEMGFIDGLGAAEKYVNNLTVGFPVEQKRIAAELATRQNDQYNLAVGAASGDAMSLLLKRGRAFENSTGFAGGIGDNSVRSGVVSGVFGAAGSGVNAFGQFIQGNPLGAVGSAVGGVANALSTGTEIGMGLTRGRAEVQAYDAKMSLERAKNQIPAALLQAGFDYQSTLAGSSYSMGGDRNAFIGISSDDTFMKSTGSRFKDVNEMAKYAGALSGATGMRGPRWDPNRGMVGLNDNILTGARDLVDFQRGGYGSVGENIGRVGGLAQSGASNPIQALAQAVGQAVASGFDNSKAVGQMVESTAALAERSGMSAAGVDGSAGITALLGASMRNQGTTNQFQAMAGANRAIAGSDATAQDTTVSLNNMLRFGKMKALFGTGAEANAAMNITATQMGVLQKGGDSAVALAGSLGLKDSFVNANGSMNNKMLNKVADVQLGHEIAGGSSATALITGAELGASEEDKRRVLDMARKAGVRPSQLNLTNPKDRAAAKAIALAGLDNGTGWRPGGAAQTITKFGGSTGASADSADIIEGAPGAKRTKEATVGNQLLSPIKGASAIAEELNALTPDMMLKMAESSAAVAENMGFNTVELKTLNSNLKKLNERLAGGSRVIERASRDGDN